MKNISKSLLEELVKSMTFYAENATSSDNKLYFQGQRDAFQFLLDQIV